MLTILYNGRADQAAEYSDALGAALTARGIAADIVTETDAPERVDYMLYAPNGPITDLAPFTGLKLIQSLWAGVETALKNETLTQPLARMVEDGMSQGMADYVLGHVLRHHLGTDHFAAAAPGAWHEERIPPLASERKVALLGLGALGLYCAEKTKAHGFDVAGWSRTAKDGLDMPSFAGADGLEEILAWGDIFVLLMPDTPETTHVINSSSLAKMKKGAVIINPGRGPLIDDDALLDALDTGHIAGATLDVFGTEPLPADHRYWTHPRVLVTPHVASATRVSSAAGFVAENIQRGESGQPFLHLVDRSVGY